MKNQIQDLLKLKTKADRAYYNSDAAIMTDAEYDELKTQLRSLLMDPLPVGVAPDTAAKTITRASSMLSLRVDPNVGRTGVLDFAKRINELIGNDASVSYTLEYKADGMAACIRYVNGVLFQASTRGDGTTGEDITAAMSKVWTVPGEICTHMFGNDIELSGEITCTRHMFDKYNEKCLKNNKPVAASQRSLAVRLIRSRNLSEEDTEFLNGLLFFLYKVPTCNGNIQRINSQYLRLKHSRFMHLAVYEPTNDLAMLNERVNYLLDNKPRNEIDCDGLVLKVDELDLQDKLGSTVEYPNWAVVFKHAAVKTVATVIGVDFNVGRTGVISATAVLNPVRLRGSLVERVSLAYGSETFDELGFEIGMEVELSLAGDVIPKITNVVRRPNGGYRRYTYPQTCHCCGTKLKRINDKGLLYCTNGFSCLEKALSILKYFVSKKGLNIKGLSDSGVEALFERAYVMTYADFFKLNIHLLKSLFGDKKGASVYNELQAARQMDTLALLDALSIPGFAIDPFTASDTNTPCFKSIRSFVECVNKGLARQHYSETSFNKIKMFLSEPNVNNAFEELSDVQDNQVTAMLPFQNKTFLLIGVFEFSTKDELEEVIKLAGGHVIEGTPRIGEVIDYVIHGVNTLPSLLKYVKKTYKNSVVISENGKESDFFEAFGLVPGDWE